jgi:hypothetical protein
MGIGISGDWVLGLRASFGMATCFEACGVLRGSFEEAG